MKCLNRSKYIENGSIRILYMILTAVILIAWSVSCRADGILLPIVRPRPIEIVPDKLFTVKYHYVNVNIDNQACTTKVDQIFHNDTSTDREGLYVFPMPEGSAITRFSMYDGEKEIVGKILSKEEARNIYQSIVRQRKDPALLEYIDRNTFQASVYPVPANGDKRIKLDYSEILRKSGTTCRYVYPLSTERFSARPISDVKITINIKSRLPITNIYSPTHQIKVERDGDNKATVTYQVKDSKPDTDLILYYTVSDDDLGMDFITHRTAGEDGYFLLLASPKPDTSKVHVQPKSVIFVLDRTGSMAGEKIDQAKDALRFCLNSLRAEDSFNLITFNESPKSVFTNLKKANKVNIKEALDEVDQVSADGGTNINDALASALKQFASKDDGNAYVVFLTDGLPTVGITDKAKILENAKESNLHKAKVFLFGVGYDVDVHLLDMLAENTRGYADYVRPRENIESKVSDFFTKVSDPLLSNPELQISGVKIYDVLPMNLPDIFKGSQLLIFGRYSGSGAVTVTIKGRSSGKTQTFKLNTNAGSREEGNEFIAQLWASKKIGFLLDEIRLHNNKELIDEVIRLSKEYGIPTEFTSFLADDRRMTTDIAAMRAEANDKFDTANRSTSGSYGVAQSSNNQAMKSAAQIPGGAAPVAADRVIISGKGAANNRMGGTYYDSEDRLVIVNNVQNISKRTFYQRGEYWEDASLKENQNFLKIKQFSQAHFDLVKAYPKLAQYSTLGNVRVVMPNNQAVEIGPNGKDTLSTEEIKDLVANK